MQSIPRVKRGDIYDVDWGGESGIHPALIIQNDIGNERSSYTIIAYITHTIKSLPVMVSFSDHESGLEHGGSVDLGRIVTIPKSRLGDKRGHLSSLKMPQVNEAIMASLGIE